MPGARHPLDGPVWSALTTRQVHFCAVGTLARRFPIDVGPLAAARDDSPEALAALVDLAPKGDEISLMQVAPPRAPDGIIATEARVLQMTWEKYSQGACDAPIQVLGDDDADDMLRLARLTRPGPFRTRTHTVGQFFGVRDGGRLVAMAGDRLKLEGYSEISGVCTHPNYRGRGLGAGLMRAVGARILSEGACPILHTYAANAGAIALYRSLGFVVRTEMAHAVWTRAV